jgi:hypothetical protein
MKASLLTAGALACTLATLASAQKVNRPEKIRTPETERDQKLQLSEAKQLALKQKLAVQAQQTAAQQGSSPVASAGSTPPGSIMLVASGSDTCGVPTPISGSGPFAYDTALQTTGAEGQAEAACLFFGQIGIENDGWYAWTSGAAGTYILTFCGTATNDSKVAVYNGSGCPGAAAIACNDDSCGLQSQLSFAAAASTTYTIQVGQFPGAATGAGTFAINLAPPAPGNDLCASATPISGAGPHAWNNMGALTDGPSNCGIMTKDVWYDWTSGAAGNYVITLCAGTVPTLDTVLSVYNGAGCPVGAPLDCDDDFCVGFGPSRVVFSAAAASVYKIQLGVYNNGTEGSGTFDIVPAPPAPANDLCANAIAISGAGPHAWDNTSALQDGPATCGLFTGDLWYDWTAGATGSMDLSTCAQSAIDTMISVYDTAACQGTQLGCNDQFCGNQSQLSFPATSGNVYKIQVGGWNGQEGPGTFTINPTPPPPANDVCGSPVAISGAGPHAFDTTSATTGAEGQNEGLCLAFGSTFVDNDAWYTWTAGSTGLASLSVCGQSTVDTKVGIYPGSPACPTNGSALACNDDACGLQSELCFNVTSGQTYTIQMGVFPGANGGAGTFGITVGGPGAICQADDGTTEDLGSLGGPGESVWLMRMGPAAGSTTVSNIQVVYGTAMFPGNTPPNGTPTKVVLYDDPNDDGDPSDAVLIQSVNHAVVNVDTDIYNTVPITPAVMNGYFFVGAGEVHPTANWVAPIDTSSNECEGRAWIFGDTTAADYNNVNNNSLPITAAAGHFGFPVNFLVRAGCGAGGPMVGQCFPGTGGVINCPCGSQAPANPAGGCANHGAGSTSGGVLSGSGVADVSADTLSISVSNLRAPASGVLNVFFSYKPGGVTPTPGTISGAGVRCTGTGGSLKRLYTVQVFGGSISKPGMGDLSVSAQSATFPGHAIVPPETRYYFNVYRDGQASLPANCNNPAVTTNLTNMGQVAWVP